ncbi:MAG: acyl-CoA thioesterase [Proteobacteria bacterium]|nr:acyl-CoA thioesterase [Pseudomonadota bacterium]
MDRKLLHTTRMPIRWSDMDAMGHVNNTVFFRYMEQARVEWLSQTGFTVKARSEGPVVVNASCTFIRQLQFPGEVEVRTYVGQPGRSSFETIYEICRTDEPDVLVAEGAAKVVWVDFGLGKSTPLPEDLRQLLRSQIT